MDDARVVISRVCTAGTKRAQGRAGVVTLEVVKPYAPGDRLTADVKRGARFPSIGVIVAVRAVSAGHGKSPLELVLLGFAMASAPSGHRAGSLPRRASQAGSPPAPYHDGDHGRHVPVFFRRLLILGLLLRALLLAGRRQRRLSPALRHPLDSGNRARITLALEPDSGVDPLRARRLFSQISLANRRSASPERREPTESEHDHADHSEPRDWSHR